MLNSCSAFAVVSDHLTEIIMDRNTLPTPEFTPQELSWLQDVLDNLRAVTFNQVIEAKHHNKPCEAEEADYKMARALRDKVYHMNGRDTLAPGNHQVRWWDQRHDY